MMSGISGLVFLISKLLWILLRPSSLLLLLGLLGLLLLYARRRTGALVCLTLSLGAMGLVVLLPIGPLMLEPLESRFPEVTVPPAQVDGIIVLGGAVDTDLTEAHGIPALNDAGERMTTLVALSRRYPDAILAFTGGNGRLLRGRLSEADVARSLFGSLGVRPELPSFAEMTRVMIGTFQAVGADVHTGALLPQLFMQAGAGSPDGIMSPAAFSRSAKAIYPSYGVT